MTTFERHGRNVFECSSTPPEISRVTHKKHIESIRVPNKFSIVRTGAVTGTRTMTLDTGIEQGIRIG